MSKHRQKSIQPLAGQFLGWGDDRIPHCYIKLATASGEQVVKVAKNLRPLIQDWQPGTWLTLLGQKQVNLTTGETSIKVKQLLTSLSLDDCSRPPTQSSLVAVVDSHVEAIAPVASAQIRVCQGASCRRRGSDGICRAMQTYLDQHDLTEQVEIKPVKCLHQCKTAPHAIVTQLSSGAKLEKTHYRQLQTYQIKAILDRHFPFAASAKPSQDNLITKISNYLQHQIGSTSTAI